MNANTNMGCYLNFLDNASLGDALNDKNPGDKFTIELELQVLSKDEKGMACEIVPGSETPAGFELEDTPDDDDTPRTPQPQPPGDLNEQPINVLTSLRRKGKAPQKGY